MGRPLGSKNGTAMSCVPDTMKPFMRITSLLNQKQLAEVLGISYGALRVLRSKDPSSVPRPILIGGVMRWRASDIDAWILSQKQI